MQASALSSPGVEAEADQVADHDHQPDDQDVAHEVGHRAADQHGRARHRHRAEAVHHAALEVLGQADRRLGRPEGDRLHEDAGQQEVDVLDSVAASPFTAPPKTYANSSTNMIGWIVEKISSCGWRMKWRRLRAVTTQASVTAERSVSRGRTVEGRSSLRRVLRGLEREPRPAQAGRSPSLARRRARELQEHVVERRPAQPELAHADPGLAQRRRGVLDSSSPSRGAGSVSRSGRSSGSGSPQPTPREHRTAPRRGWPRWPARPRGSARRPGPSARCRCPRRSPGRGRSPRSGRPARRPPRGTGSSAGSSSPRGRARARSPRSGCGCAGRARWWARRGTGSAGA